MTSTIHRQSPARGDQIPDFTALTPEGAELRSRDFYHRRNLALLFVDTPDCDVCQALLRDLAREYDAIRAETGELIALLPDEPGVAARLRETLDLPFPVVADPDRAIARRYGLVDDEGRARAALFVTDRYGTVYTASLADAGHRLLPAREVPGWLGFVACECS